MSVTQLVAGANCPVPSEKLQVEVTLSPAQVSGVEVDISAFVLTATGKVRGDDDMVFYGQPRPGNGSVAFVGNSAGRAEFAVDLPNVLAGTEKIAFTATIHENRTNFGAFTSLQVTVKNAAWQAVLVVTLPATGMVESALILGELYLRQGQWKFRAVGQGFAGGLKPLAEHFGVDISDAPAPAPNFSVAVIDPVVPLSTHKITKTETKVVLTKKSDSQKISLQKQDNSNIIASAIWVDNGDARSNNDDLDLRAGILLPNGVMKIIHCGRLGSLSKEPYVFHLGDVKSASTKEPGMETIEVSSKISANYSGNVAIVFSVYSAMSNGDVSIASLKPKMRLQYKNQTVDCSIDFAKDKLASRKHIYTYVIGMAIIRDNEIEITPCGLTSEPRSEATPWMIWDTDRKPKITMDGPAVGKSSGGLMVGMLNMGNKKKYE